MDRIYQIFQEYYRERSSDVLNDVEICVDKLDLDELIFNTLMKELKESVDISQLDIFFKKNQTDTAAFEEINWKLYFYMLPALAKAYESYSLPKKVYYKTLEDLTWRLKFYLNKNEGQLGLTTEDKMWLSRIYHLKIFKLASLQFEKIKIEGQPVLSVHIMAGEDISRASSFTSFCLALEFFDKYFPEYTYENFYCKSWLLYPRNRKFLNKESKIIQFMDMFNIVDEEQDTLLPYKYIFYVAPEEVRPIDAKTSLQKHAYNYPEDLGVGTGIIKKEKVIKGCEKGEEE